MIGGVRVHRLSVRERRLPERFGPIHGRIMRQPYTPLYVQRDWLRLQGPDIPELEPWLHDNARRFDAAIFFTYLYPTTAFGLPVASEYCPTILVPTAHDEPMFDLRVFDTLFRAADGIICLAPEELDLVRRRFRFEPDAEVVGLGLEPHPVANGQRFRDAYGLDTKPYIVVLGRIDPGKGSDELHRFFIERRSPEPGLGLVVVGEQVRPSGRSTPMWCSPGSSTSRRSSTRWPGAWRWPNRRTSRASRSPCPRAGPAPAGVRARPLQGARGPGPPEWRGSGLPQLRRVHRDALLHARQSSRSAHRWARRGGSTCSTTISGRRSSLTTRTSSAGSSRVGVRGAGARSPGRVSGVARPSRSFGGRLTRRRSLRRWIDGSISWHDDSNSTPPVSSTQSGPGSTSTASACRSTSGSSTSTFSPSSGPLAGSRPRRPPTRAAHRSRAPGCTSWSRGRRRRELPVALRRRRSSGCRSRGHRRGRRAAPRTSALIAARR